MSTKSRLINIDIIRIISLLIVMFSHYSLESFDSIDGTHGVVLFFFVSGFCISMTAGKKEYFLDFWKARLIRLVPTLIVCGAIVTLIKIYFVSYIADRASGVKDFLYTSFCVPTLDIPCLAKAIVRNHGDYSFVDGSYWSLLVEFRFYFLFGLIYFFTRIPKIDVRRNIGSILAVFGLLALATVQISPAQRINDFFQYLCFFSFGIGFQQVYSDDDRIPGLLAMANSLILMFVLYVTNAFTVSMPGLKQMMPYNLVLCGLFVGLMLSLRKLSNLPDTALKIIARIGLLTYPAYLLHQDIGLILLAMFSKEMNHFALGLLIIIFIFLLSEITERSVSFAISKKNNSFRKIED